MGKRAFGFAAQRSLPKWRRSFLNSLRRSSSDGKAGEVVLFVDTFNNYFEPENARAALAVLDRRATACMSLERATARGRCACGRTFLAAGMVEQAKSRRNGCWPRSSLTWDAESMSSASSLPAF